MREQQTGSAERRVPVQTPSGTFQVWTRESPGDPGVRLLLLHGGPGATSEYFEGVSARLREAGVAHIEYDQLGSHRSDQPDDPALWTIDRFVDEVEQVRVALGLGPDDFYLLGHSWGGVLAVEYALRHQQHLKGLIISNMMMSVPEYNRYAEQVLMPPMDQTKLAEIKRLEAEGQTTDPGYDELLMEQHYVHHVLRRPAGEWPEPVVRSFAHINSSVYVPMQGPSELGASGVLLDWDRTADLHRIAVPALVIGGAHDTMDPAHMARVAAALPHGKYLHCPEGSHLAMWDDEETYVQGLLAFLRDTATA